MTTALATVDAGGYLALQAGGEILEAMAANLGEGASLKESDLTRVKTPSGGGTTWSIPSITGDEDCKEIVGVICYMCVRGLLWRSDEPEEGSLPVLMSHDLKTAKLVIDRADVPEDMLADIDAATGPDGEIDWEKLPQSQFGSGKNGNGKAVKEQRVLYILREQDTLPIVVAINPGSLKDWGRFVVEMTKAGVPYWRAVVGLSLEKEKSTGGSPYSKVVPRLVGVLTPEQGKSIYANVTPMARAAAETSFA